MSEITVERLWPSDDFKIEGNDFGNSESSASIAFVVKNAEDEKEALDAAWNFADETIGDSIPKARCTVQERCGERIWKVSVEYEYNTFNSQVRLGGNAEEEEDSKSHGSTASVSFDCQVENENVVVPIAQRLVYASPGAPPLVSPQSIPIGWNGKTNQEVEFTGVEMPSAATRENYVRRLDYSTVTSSNWKRRIAECTGKVNIGYFKGWQPGEVMFLGANYDTPLRGANRVTVQFNFQIRTNEYNKVLYGIPIGDVRGHDYIWCVYDNARIPNSQGWVSLAPRIKYIFVSQVAKYVSFSSLGV